MKTIHYLTVLGLAGLMSVSAPAFAHDGDGPGAKGPHHHMGCDPLPPADAKLVHDAMQKSMAENKASFEQMHALHEKMHAIVKAPDFDRKAFLATRDEITGLRDKMERNRAEAMADVFAKLPPQERERVAHHLMMMKRHGFHHHGGPGGWKHGSHEGWNHGDRPRDGQGSAPTDTRNHSWDNLNQ